MRITDAIEIWEFVFSVPLAVASLAEEKVIAPKSEIVAATILGKPNSQLLTVIAAD